VSAKTPPKYSRQRRRDGRPDQAYVRLGTRKHWLGVYGSAESHDQYQQIIADWKANGEKPIVPHDDLRTIELIDRYTEHVQAYYRHADGSPTTEVTGIRYALRPLKELYGTLPASEFRALRLQAVRDRMVELGWARRHVNKQVGRIVRMFKWAVAQELVDSGVYDSLKAVAGLKRGRTTAPETAKVRPVSDADVDAIKSFVTGPVWALIQLQRLTGARGGELFKLRPSDLNMSGAVWTAECLEHKNAHRGQERTLYFGRRAQAVIRPFLAGRPTDAYLFRPCDAVLEHNEKRHAARETPMSCGNTPGSNRKRKPKRTARDHYTRDSYGRAIRRACKKAGIPSWHPHRLRHTRATELKRKFGIEAARVILGHKSPQTTELYAEQDTRTAVDVMRRIG